MAKREPAYLFHKPTGQGYVRLNGRCVYLGAYNSQESLERYARIKSEWLVNRHAFEAKKVVKSGPFMADLRLAYLDHALGVFGSRSHVLRQDAGVREPQEGMQTTVGFVRESADERVRFSIVQGGSALAA